MRVVEIEPTERVNGEITEEVIALYWNRECMKYASVLRKVLVDKGLDPLVIEEMYS